MIDLFFFRPISFLLVKILIKFPITPNQITSVSIFLGIISGIIISIGTRSSFIIGAILYGLTHIMDCCDGMVARLKNNGTLTGRIVDGVADYITSISAYIGLYIALQKGVFNLPFHPWVIMLLSAISLGIHCMVVDYYRHEFLANALGKVNTIKNDQINFSNELIRLKTQRGKYIEKLLITLYLGYLDLQSKIKITRVKKQYNKEEYYKANKTLLFLWNWIGSSTHIAVLLISLVLFSPMIFFIYILIVANIWMIVMGFVQYKMNQKLIPKE